MLSQQEYSELVGLINMIEVIDCFGTRDIMRRCMLENKTTDKQLIDAYAACGLNVDDLLETA
jgi:hypothetical protein